MADSVTASAVGIVEGIFVDMRELVRFPIADSNPSVIVEEYIEVVDTLFRTDSTAGSMMVESWVYYVLTGQLFPADCHAHMTDAAIFSCCERYPPRLKRKLLASSYLVIGFATSVACRGPATDEALEAREAPR